MAESKYRETPEPIETMPPGVPYIVGNEAAERFSYYGMRAILTVFMADYLHLMSDQIQPAMSEAEATEHYHTFSSWVYLFPIFGALISDTLTGKYRIIIWVSVLYCIGHLSLAMMGAAQLAPETWMWIGLFLIALGSGGIKPCVSAHVGDQFGSKNQHLMPKVYQWFYFSINFGSMFSYFLTPWLLEWYGPHVAFGVPGILMGIATLAFWMGRTTFVHMPPAGVRFLEDVFSRTGLFTIGKLLLVYFSISAFWALFDQTGSAWVLQAQNMDRQWLGMLWLESQIGAVNPILVMLLIPIFQFGLYPAINKVFTLTPLRKISIGLFLAAASFALSSLIQEWIDTGSRPSIAWQILSYVILTAAEVMVSITGLEFSYSQAPKSMKSVVMSIWLLSVSLGNYVTAAVNHFIQVPGINQFISDASGLSIEDQEKTYNDRWVVKALPVEEATDAEEKSKTHDVLVAGYDRKFDTEDDFRLTYDQYGNLTDVSPQNADVLKEAKQRIDEHFFASAENDSDMQLPDDQAGAELLTGLQDATGNALQFHRVTRDRYRIVSAGADGTFETPWDEVLEAKVSRVNKKTSASEDKPLSWREKRIIELKGDVGRKEVEEARGEIPKTKISESFTVGGQVTLEGASYFWFWTYVMFGAAVLFVPIAYFYKDQTQIPDDESPDHPAPPEDHALTNEET